MKYATIGLLLLLPGCGFFEKEVKITTVPEQQQMYQPADPRPLQLENVNFIVVTKENLDQVLAKLKKEQGTDSFVFIAIRVRDYENLSINLQELKRYIDQQGQIVVYYKKITTVEKPDGKSDGKQSNSVQ